MARTRRKRENESETDASRGPREGRSGRRLGVASLGIAALLAAGFLLWPRENGLSSERAPQATPADAVPAAPETSVAAPSAPTPRSVLRITEPERLGLQVLASYPHDPTAYTQGLLWHDGELYESTGLNGRSSLRRVKLESGQVLQKHDLSEEFFGEGLASAGGRLVQITWKEGVAFVYDPETFETIETWSYSGDGWGLCSDGDRFYMTDGSPRLTVRSTEDFSVLDTRTITLRGRPQGGVNELECVDGAIWGNVYGSQVLVRIEPESAVIDGLVDASGLLSADDRVGVDVLNGIAYDPESGAFYLTGKLWPKLFEVALTGP